VKPDLNQAAKQAKTDVFPVLSGEDRKIIEARNNISHGR